MSEENKYDKYIKIWRFHDAPTYYKNLSENGGDEDWIAFIPDSLSDGFFPWMEEGTPFGCCCVDEYKVDGGVIKIGCHS